MIGLNHSYTEQSLQDLMGFQGAEIDTIDANLAKAKEAIEVEGWIADQFPLAAESGQGSSTKSIGRIICTYVNLAPSLEDVFSKHYNINPSGQVRSMDEADIYLLGENHDTENCRWRALNGKFISYLADFYELMIFVESTPSMQGVDSAIAKEELMIQTNNPHIYFLGWDAAEEIMSPVHELHKKVIKNCEEYALWSKDSDVKRKAYQEQLDSVSARVCTSVISQTIQALDQKNITEKMVALFSETSVKMIERLELISSLTSEITRTFPARTAAQVSTLKGLRSFSARRSFLPRKVVFIQGTRHLEEDQKAPKKEEQLDSLYQEIEHHHAMTMIPSISHVA